MPAGLIHRNMLRKAAVAPPVAGRVQTHRLWRGRRGSYDQSDRAKALDALPSLRLTWSRLTRHPSPLVFKQHHFLLGTRLLVASCYTGVARFGSIVRH